MILPAIAIAVLLQAPAARPAAVPASISGVVVQSGTNEPLANVRVALARTDAALGAFGQMVAGDHPPAEMTIPGELLSVMAEEIAGEAANGGLPPEANAEAKAFAALPLLDIEELVVSVNGEVAVVFKSAPPVMTDAQGRFSFTSVEPGTYKLVFSSNGFARQDYGQRGPGGTGIPIALTAGQTKSDIVMRMSQVAAIGGRITDTGGRPAAGVPIQLFRFAYDETGQRKVQSAASAQTDDRGDYRIFHLSPGRYYLSVGNQPGQSGTTGIAAAELLGIGGATASANRIPEKYTLSYYPGVVDANSAAPIDVPSGGELNGIDMAVRPQQTYRVRGTVVDTRNALPPASVNIQLNLQSPDPQGRTYVGFSDGAPNYDRSDGTFELRNISSGAYAISVNLPNPALQRPGVDLANMSPAEQQAYFEAQDAAAAAAPKASAVINVANSDIEGVQLRVGLSGAIPGTIRIEQAQSAAAPEIAFLRIQLRVADGAPNNSDSRAPKPDGTFRLDGLWPGEYRLVVNGLPAGFYIKEARLGETDLLNGRFRYTGAESSALNIVISSSTGQIDGNAANSQGQPLPGARVVLIPERSRDRTELFRPVNTDPNGHFVINGVAPGDYKLAAWEAIEPFAFFDADLLKQADDNGKPVHVVASSTQTVNVVPLQ